ncbi:MAG: putative porin [Marinilabiliaceae bacterium]|nr:putative porin [Marinilabiliaceae bacterium]
MKLKISLLIYVALTAQVALAQFDPETGRPSESQPGKTEVVKHIKTWRLSEGYTLADTLQPDTMLIGFQQHNPILRHNPFTLHLGNIGSPAQSMTIGDQHDDQDFIFNNALLFYQPKADQWLFYNTTLPYTNLYYQNSGPKRRSEENIGILFTQNINKAWNAGINYNMHSNIGRYSGQNTENRLFRFFTSFNSKAYQLHAALSLYKFDQLENGGIEDNNYIVNGNNPEYSEIEPENIPVWLQNTKHYLRTQRYLLNQSLNIGKISRGDSLQMQTLPVGTLFHTLEVNATQRRFNIDNLPTDNRTGKADQYFSNIYADSLVTRDTLRYTEVKNTVQLRFNEEANSLLKFGLRAYLENEIQTYQRDEPGVVLIETGQLTASSIPRKKTFINTAVGGQIFKNTGNNFWWNAGAKTYITGNKIGDMELSGMANSSFRVGKDTAGIFALGDLTLRSPGYLFETYYSNHFFWNNDFRKEKTLRVKGGIRIPTQRFEITGEARLINDCFYWNEQALPNQSSEVLQLVEIALSQHFRWGILNSVNKVSYQVTSNDRIRPLPMLSVYSANYIEHLAFKVLRFQIGFDVRYFTQYYAPAYMPATGQFYAQRLEKIGEYPFADAFANFHLKRARIGVKWEHVNDGLMGIYNSFLLPGYPNNPRAFKIQVSWNFYD